MTKSPQCTCPKAQQLFMLLGKKWVIFIMQAVNEGCHSFKTIRSTIGDANTKILSDRLEELTLVGILARHIGAETPGAVRYSLTPLGEALSEKLISLSHWWGGTEGIRITSEDDKLCTTG